MRVSRRGKVRMFLTGATLAGITGGTTAQVAVRKPELDLKQSAGVVRGVDYNRDVRPILSQHCFKCHGPDEGQRQAKLRLDQRAGAFALLSSSRKAVVPGKPEASTLVTRVFSHGANIMPPAYANKPLSEREKDTLKQWIANGATYQPHWAFVPPHAAPIPHVKNTAWPRNPIDNFILARLEQQGLKPSPPADRYTLVRRVYLDLIGIPPTPEEADAFLKDTSPDAYEKLVDRLLASPHYGEKWARRWLDLARYADTNGYEKDRPRSVWPYRDWVINALNHDMPFNQFTIEQIAGDMLPNATLDQKIATGFHRNTMLNEEGGIDPLEYRFYSLVDRTATTGVTWLGLTIGCAQCHTHKFDPITQKEYYRFMACLDNTEEPTIDVTTPDVAAKRNSIEAQAGARTAKLAEQFPPESDVQWSAAPAATIATVSGATGERLPDNSLRLSGVNPELDTYTVTLDSNQSEVSQVKLEVLPDASLGNNGPGRTPHGNFVLTELKAAVAPKEIPDKSVPVKFVRATSDFAQDGFPAQNAIDGDSLTGWAIAGQGNWNVARTATFALDKPLHFAKGGKWTFRLEQNYGGHHTIGRFRLSLGHDTRDSRPLELRRREHLDKKFGAWLNQAQTNAVHWRVARPTKATSNLPLLTVQDDDSVFVSGDMTKRDVYDLDFRNSANAPITAIRLEVLPDERLPQHGPGRVFYEGGMGDFFLSELTTTANGKPVPFRDATQNGGNPAQTAIDGEPLTGWSISGRQGESTVAIFRLSSPLATDTFSLRMIFERYFAAALGRFRISVTSDTPSALQALPPDVESVLTVSVSQRNATQQETLRNYFLSIAPELQPERDAIAQLRQSMPAYPTALAFVERPANNPRITTVHHRGEYLQPKEAVTPGVPAILPEFPANAPANRLTFANWIASPKNPLTARVVVNRQWAALFGRGLVKSVDDFGYQGDPPTHPELLDWLASNFVAEEEKEKRRKGEEEKKQYSSFILPPSSFACAWSLKKLHRLFVTSATYRQSSQVTPTLVQADPENKLLARSSRVRLDAELVRDSVLAESGLLSAKIGGPSVFPPQPPGVTSEGTYGPLAWNVSTGDDRYRRGLYTFSKRTAPYAMFTTFDAPSGEACVARREVSNTPLQALTLLNDQVFVEAAQALGKQMAARTGTETERIILLFRYCLTRPPTTEETNLLLKFYNAQKERLAKKELNAAVIAGQGDGDANSRAAWTLLARSLLNLDETITKK